VRGVRGIRIEKIPLVGDLRGLRKNDRGAGKTNLGTPAGGSQVEGVNGGVGVSYRSLFGRYVFMRGGLERCSTDFQKGVWGGGGELEEKGADLRGGGEKSYNRG